jgi:photosystem II stability/assembly factor-like uncharacterized protein
MKKYRIINAAFLIGILASVAAAGPSFSDPVSSMKWHPLRIGAGGFLTGLDISPDGSTRVVRADTYGAYIWDSNPNSWRQIVTSNSMPAADVGVDMNVGVYEIRIAPNLPARLFMAYRGYVYRSDDRGNHWTRTTFANVQMNANDDFRTMGQKMAVDPANPDIVYVGTPASGIFVTNDGGATWRSVNDIPKSRPALKGQYPGHAGIVFDTTSARTHGKTNTIYASSYGNGVYRSVDAGASWVRLADGPENVSHAKLAADGAYYAVGDDWQTVWRYHEGAWTDITPVKGNGTWDTVVTDPSDPAHVIAIRQGGYLDISHDRGAKWGGIIWGPGYNPRIANDIPWLAWTNETYMTTGEMLFDPVKLGRIWSAEGIGVWFTDIPDVPATPRSITFTSQSKGIEQLVANEVISPPDGKPVVASWDRPVFYVADRDAFPSTHGPDNQHAIVMGWALDYASTNPAFLVGLMNWWGIEKSGYSMDGGRTWTKFAAYPADSKIGGGIAASTPKNIVWVPSNNGVPYYTTDGGATWIRAAMPGAPTAGQTGWGNAFFLNRHIVAADRVMAGTFYIYNSVRGLYRSSDGGGTWALVYHHEIAPWSGSNATLKSVPGQSGHLFFTSGPQGTNTHPAVNRFMRSTDGGATWTAVPNVLEVRAFGFGQSLNEYPTIFICGWVKGLYGIWRSNDNARSWTRIGEFPLGIIDTVKTIDGDKDVPNLVYVGFAGSGYAYGIEQ